MDELDALKLKRQVELLTRQLAEKQQAPQQDDRVASLQKELAEMKDKYVFLLESLVKLQASQENRKLPIELSNSNPPVSTGTSQINLGVLQVLRILKESRATSREFAVTSGQLKKAFSVDKSERTVRNKLNYLEAHNLVVSFGKKPKVYYLTPSGLGLLNEQMRGSLGKGI